MLAILINSLSLLAILCIPAFFVALAIHLFEYSVQMKLASRWGWRSVMITGWLGTPIHELSHVIMCFLFRHRIDEVRFFDPDPASGCLGYVKHSYRQGNWFEELGNGFIGIAPFLGGSIALLGLSFLFYPELTLALFRIQAGDERETWSLIAQIPLQAFTQFLSSLFTVENLQTVRLWLFLYLCLCIAAHMAPSKSDYAGALRGLILIAQLFLIVAILAMTFTRDLPAVAATVVKAVMPVMILGVLSLALCCALYIAVTIICLMTAEPRPMSRR